MESKNIQSVVFADLEDAKLVMIMVSDTFGTMLNAYQLMNRIGTRVNSGAMAEARKDITRTGELLIAVMEEFKRLHSAGCNCGTSDDEVQESIEGIRAFVADVKTESRNVGPVDNNPAHAVQDLASFLGAIGAPIDGTGTTPDTRNASGGNEPGTGLYL